MLGRFALRKSGDLGPVVKGNTRGRTMAESDLRRLRSAPTVRRIVGRNWSKADVFVHELDGIRVALKDYRARPLLVRETLGRWLVRREARAYDAASGVPGLPRFYGRADAFALATEWIEAEVLADLEPRSRAPGWDDRLAAILTALHERGVALGDLHQRDVLLSPTGDVHVIDLATALVRGARPGPLRRFLFERFRDQDRVALARMRARHAGLDEDAAVLAVGESAARWYRRGRRVRRWLDRLRGKGRLAPR